MLKLIVGGRMSEVEHSYNDTHLAFAIGRTCYRYNMKNGVLQEKKLGAEWQYVDHYNDFAEAMLWANARRAS